jgi:hypothetical protein
MIEFHRAVETMAADARVIDASHTNRPGTRPMRLAPVASVNASAPKDNHTAVPTMSPLVIAAIQCRRPGAAGVVRIQRQHMTSGRCGEPTDAMTGAVRAPFSYRRPAASEKIA